MPLLAKPMFALRPAGVPLPPASPGSAVLRIREIMATGDQADPTLHWSVTVTSPNPVAGRLKALLPAEVTQNAGVYAMDWGVKNAAGAVIAVDSTVLLVERSLFAQDSAKNMGLGPPSLEEVRMQVMDSSPIENSLLDALQFDDAQIVSMFRRPIDTWNATPPVKPEFMHNTRTFPYREMWLRGVLGYMHTMIANHFRRNRLAWQGGKAAIDDKNREREYMQEGMRLLTEFKVWCEDTKLSLNTANAWDICNTVMYGLG